MSPEDFHARCAKHDWYYRFSDDPRKHNAGRDAELELSALADEDVQLNSIYAAWLAHKFSGRDFGTRAVPEPTPPARPSTFPGEPAPHNPNQTSLF